MECGQNQTLLSALASLLRKDSEGNVYLNLKKVSKDCEDIPLVDCDLNHLPFETLLSLAIGDDDCDHKTLNIAVEQEVWDDLRITPGSFDRPGISDPAYVAYAPNDGALTVYVPEFGKDDFVSFFIQMPHGYKEGTNILVHLHWTPGARGNEENGALVGWKVDYTWANYGENFSDMQTADLSDACDGVDHRHQMTTEVSINGTGKTISSMLLCNVRRTDGGADDTWSSALSGQLPLLLEVDFHYRLDSLGSRTHSNK